MSKTAARALLPESPRETVASRFCTLTNYSGRVRAEPLRPRTVLLRGDPYRDPLVRGALESSAHVLRQSYRVEEDVEDGVVVFLFSAQCVAAKLDDDAVVCSHCSALDEDEHGRPHRGLLAQHVPAGQTCAACGVDLGGAA